MKVSGSKGLKLDKVLESLHGLMAQFMRDGGQRIKQMGRDDSSISMDQCIPAPGLMISAMAKESTTI